MTEYSKEDESEELTPCEEKGYKVGDLFEVQESEYGSKYHTKGMVVELIRDDNSDSPKFRYVSGNTSEFMNKTDDCAFISLDILKKIGEVIRVIKLIEEPEVINKLKPLAYTAEQILQAFNHLEWMDESLEKLLLALDVVSDPEYQKYLELKSKFEK